MSSKVVRQASFDFIEFHHDSAKSKHKLGFALAALSFVHKHQIDGTDDEEECQNVVPVQVGTLKHDVGNDTEYSQRDAFLYDLQLDEVKGAAILDEADTVGGYLATVLQKGNAPREYDNAKKRPVAAGARFL
jgi:hypothetical protein